MKFFTDVKKSNISKGGSLPLAPGLFTARAEDSRFSPLRSYGRSLPLLRGHPATLRLSDAFITMPEKPTLELVVSVTNINYNKGSQILRTCKPLKEYTLFVEAVRRHTRLDSENGFKNAIKECIQNDILREYLQRKSREVMNMLIAEYDYDVDIAVQREEVREIALQEGSYQKAIETARNLLALGLSIENIAQATGLTEAEVEQL